MKKAKPAPATAPDLFAGAANPRKYRTLIVPKILQGKTESFQLRGLEQDACHDLVKKWADMESSGQLAKSKETSLDAEFLNDIFGLGLGYTASQDRPAHYHVERQFRSTFKTSARRKRAKAPVAIKYIYLIATGALARFRSVCKSRIAMELSRIGPTRHRIGCPAM